MTGSPRRWSSREIVPVAGRRRWPTPPRHPVTGESWWFRGLLGESVEIGPPLPLELSRNTGRNVLVISPAESRGPIVAATPPVLQKSDPRLEVVYFDGTRVDDRRIVGTVADQCRHRHTNVKPRDSEAEMQRLEPIDQGTGR